MNNVKMFKKNETVLSSVLFLIRRRKIINIEGLFL